MADNLSLTVNYRTGGPDGDVPVTFTVPKDKIKMDKDGKVIGGDEDYVKQAAQMALEARYPHFAGKTPPDMAPPGQRIETPGERIAPSIRPVKAPKPEMGSQRPANSRLELSLSPKGCCNIFRILAKHIWKQLPL